MSERDSADTITLGQVLVFATVTTGLMMASLFKTKVLFLSFGLAAGIAAMPFASILSILYFGVLWAAVVPMSQVPLQLPGFKLYGTDALLYFLVASAVYPAWRLVMRRRLDVSAPPAERRMVWLTVALAGIGIVGVIKGMQSGFPLNDILGDYRRMHFYPLALLVPLLLYLRPHHVWALKAVIVAACLAVLLTGAYRLATGQSFRPDYYLMYSYSPRWLDCTETVTLELGLAYCACMLRHSKPGLRLLLLLALGGASLGLLLISGWRLALLLGVLAPLGAQFLMGYALRERVSGLFKTLTAMALIGAASATLVVLAFPEKAREQGRRLEERVATFDVQDDMRYYTWTTALGVWRESPVVGAGLGHELFIHLRTSTGEFIGGAATTHCYPLDVLYQTGLLGFVVFLSLHGAFSLYVLRNLRRLTRPYVPLVIALYAGYGCNLAVHSLEPVLAGGVVLMYMSMGLVLWMLRQGISVAPSPPLSSAVAPVAATP